MLNCQKNECKTYVLYIFSSDIFAHHCLNNYNIDSGILLIAVIFFLPQHHDSEFE